MKSKAWLFAAAGFILGAVCGFVLRHALPDGVTDPGGVPLERREGQFQFINPLLECEGSGRTSPRELSSFHNELERWAADEIGKKRARSIAVYFRDLNNGPWFGIDENELFVPASLMKVPLMMAYLKHAEDDPRILRKEIAYDIEIGQRDQIIRSGEDLQRGKRYTVEYLVDKMIMDSDNNAALLLLYHDRDRYYRRLFTDLGMTPPDYNETEHRITVKEYATLFRVLFNASYLDREMSNRALNLLSRAKFRGGLVAGVHPSIAVAHKFGERNLGNEMQFHDCGIVYFPGRPYLLCVMSRGEALPELAAVVQNISQQVFNEVGRQTANGGR